MTGAVGTCLSYLPRKIAPPRFSKDEAVTYLPLCQHRDTRYTGLKGRGRVSTCVHCGAQFASLAEHTFRFSPIVPRGV